MEKIKIAVVGYGNIGKYAVEAIEATSDMELVGVVRRSLSNIPKELKPHRVVRDIGELGEVDVAILALPSRIVAQEATKYLRMGINTVDSFDIHSDIVALRAELKNEAKQKGAVAVVAAGWDPGSDSMVRAIFEMCAQVGVTHTNFGPGMSMGHSVAASAVEGVRKAMSVTIPEGKGVHSRKVFIELEKDYDLKSVKEAIAKDDYFSSSKVEIEVVASVDALKNVEHGVRIVRDGISGRTANQKFEFDMRINNPALTAQIMVNAARASIRQEPGAYTLIEIPLIDFLSEARETVIKRLV